MTEPQNNGHNPNQPQPNSQAAFEAKNTRIQLLRKVIEEREETIDYVNAMFMTSEQAVQALAAENSRLKAENDQLTARVAELTDGAVETTDA